MAAKVARKTRIVGVDPQDFSPSLLRIQSQPTSPFARAMLHLLLILLFALILWAAFGKLDVVATGEGKLIPQTYLKIVQPASRAWCAMLSIMGYFRNGNGREKAALELLNSTETPNGRLVNTTTQRR